MHIENMELMRIFRSEREREQWSDGENCIMKSVILLGSMKMVEEDVTTRK
jgi:hypothetical protein